MPDLMGVVKSKAAPELKDAALFNVEMNKLGISGTPKESVSAAKAFMKLIDSNKTDDNIRSKAIMGLRMANDPQATKLVGDWARKFIRDEQRP